MFKKLLFLLCLTLFFAQASARIYVMAPVEASLESNGAIDLGFAQPGETIEVIVSNSTGNGDAKWNQAIVQGLPIGWAALDSAIGEETFVVRVTIPANASANIYNFRVAAKSTSLGVNDEGINARLSVATGLVSVSIGRENPTETVLVGNPVSYKITLNNTSIAEHRVIIDSSLSKQWFKAQEFTVPAKEIAEYYVEVTPGMYGKKEFSFNISSALNNSPVSSFDSTLEVLPTLKGKYSPALHGFPFFTISLLPYYIINSFISLIIP